MDSRSVFLRAALALAMAAVDKVLHEAISKRFAYVAADGSLDKIVQIELSKAYRIAQAARVRTGKGGKVRRRPGHDIKAEVLTEIYRDSYLSARRIQEISAICGKSQIFKLYAAHLTKPGKKARSAQPLRERWSRMYTRRNQIVHECDIMRQAKPRKARFDTVDGRRFKRDIAFIKNFGQFLAVTLD